MNAVADAGDATLFPHLTDAWIQQIREAGAREETVPAGTVLVEEGTPFSDFFVVLEGGLDIVQLPETRIVRHGPGGFVGDTHVLAGRASVVRCVAAEDSRVLRLPVARLQRLVVEHGELSDVILKSFLARRVALVKGGVSSTRLIGSRYSSGTHRIREFLTRNSIPFVWLDIEDDPSVAAILEQLGVAVDETPVLICQGHRVFRNPTPEALAQILGLSRIAQEKVADVLVVGAGPAGLAASVYAASEGLEVVTLESEGPGGQAGASTRIENYLGFPTGITGQELAERALLQAQKFGVQVAVGRRAVRLSCEGPVYAVTTADGQVIRARSVVAASGARYRRLPVAAAERFDGQGIYYAATIMEEALCRGAAVVVVGGANSAGQACVFLARLAREVHLVARADGLDATMSRYLIRQIEQTPNIHVRLRTEVAAVEGDGHLERVRLRRSDGETAEVATPGLFVMIGAVPCTDWLCEVALDEHGFVRTGRDLGAEDLQTAHWPLAREPYPFEASKPRLFAVGDLRSDSTKRVATAVGEGSAAVQSLHRALADLA